MKVFLKPCLCMAWKLLKVIIGMEGTAKPLWLSLVLVMSMMWVTVRDSIHEPVTVP